MKQAAVVSSRGLGDGLMMMVASNLLHNQGYKVTTYHNLLSELNQWFPEHRFEGYPPLEEWHAVFSRFDLIILQYDHHRLETKLLIELYKKGKLKNLSVFFPSKESAKLETITTWDQVFDSKLSLVDNIAIAIANLFKINETSKNNGIFPPIGMQKNKYANRIIIHPTRSNDDYVWPAKKFLCVAKKLKKAGYEVVFSVSPSERPAWIFVENEGFALPLFSTLNELAKYIYESALVIGNDSGTCHLASNLHVPTIIISNCSKRMQLWRPGWLPGSVLTPPRWILNPKFYRLREKHWDLFVSPRRVMRTLKNSKSKLLG